MRLRAVIVDDSPAVLRAASDLLEREGISVVGVAGSGDDAVSLVEELKPDVILVDIDLGPESGFELARRLAQSIEGASSRVILISAHEEADYATLIAASPAIGFLSKSDLSATEIRQLLAQIRQERRY